MYGLSSEVGGFDWGGKNGRSRSGWGGWVVF